MRGWGERERIIWSILGSISNHLLPVRSMQWSEIQIHPNKISQRIHQVVSVKKFETRNQLNCFHTKHLHVIKNKERRALISILRKSFPIEFYTQYVKILMHFFDETKTREQININNKAKLRLSPFRICKLWAIIFQE